MVARVPPHKVVNLVCHQSLLRIGFSISIIRGDRILNGENYGEEGAWWDYWGIRDHGKMESKPAQEIITDGKNGKR